MQKDISVLNIDPIKPKLQIIFTNGYILFIRYNDFDEYSYHFIYSKKQLNRFRFDNYDDKWNADSNPHHLQEKNSSNGVKSPMNGDSANNIPLLLDYIAKNSIL